jgi:DNA-directed RNA polymerase subunit RPC12/RpoP
MLKCAKCGSQLGRVHRSLLQRLSYMAVYECRQCAEKLVVPRRYRFHLGQSCRCPQCGTYRVTRLREPDHIDPMVGGALNLLERLAGGKRLCHCRYCRIQFYDRREIAPQSGMGWNSRPKTVRELAANDSGESRVVPGRELSPPEN